MRERPILFSAPMVRAILDGRKTQTRRVVKGAPLGAGCGLFAKDSAVFFRGITPESPGFGNPIRCPYGVPGDRLWVRETWREEAGPHGLTECCASYAADMEPEIAHLEGPWTPSIHMPRWASRLTLELTSVRVEGLHEIDDKAAAAEGWPGTSSPETPRPPQVWFRHLWDSINAKRHGCSWECDPWVWVLEFRRLPAQ